jgi:hypothetical protein
MNVAYTVAVGDIAFDFDYILGIMQTQQRLLLLWQN